MSAGCELGLTQALHLVAQAESKVILDSDGDGYFDWVEIIYAIFGMIFWLN